MLEYKRLYGVRIMWFIGRSLLDYLNKEDIPKDKKLALIKSHKDRLKDEIKKLSPKDVVKYLFNSKVLLEVKEVICEYVDEISDRYGDEWKTKSDAILREFKKVGKKKESYVVSDTVPKIIKKYLITELYGTKLKNVVLGSKVSNKVKIAIVQTCFGSYEIKEVLKSSNASKALIDNIIDHCLESTSTIKLVLDSNDLPKDIIEAIIVKKVNKNNMFEVVQYTKNTSADFIFKAKSRDVEDYFKALTYKQVINDLKSSNASQQYIDYLFKHRYDLVEKVVAKANKKELDDLIRGDKDSRLIELIVNKRKFTTRLILVELFDFQLLTWLGLKCLPVEQKEFIFKTHHRTILRVLKNGRLYDIKDSLKTDAHVPEHIQDEIFNLAKDRLLKELESEDDKEILRTIRYTRWIPKVKRFLIKERVNKDNILDLLTDYLLDIDTFEVVLEEKKDLIKDYLFNFETNKLFTFESSVLKEEIVKGMLESAQDLLMERVKVLNTDEMLDYLNNGKVHRVVKKVIFEWLGIDSKDLDNLLYLISIYDAKLMIDAYDLIKEFIVDSGIDFDSFLQYGSGSKKYDKWIDNLLDIIENEEEDKFNSVKNYLFDNYYEVDKENAIYSISSYLEVLGSYEIFKELYNDLVSRSISLSKKDKLDLAFLHNISGLGKEDVPKNYEELNTFKEKMYKDYLGRIEKADLDKLKSIFNEVVLGKAEDLISYIGMSRALRTLKKDNRSSSSVCKLIDEMMVYTRIVEMVNDTNNVEGLREVLSYIFSDVKVLSKVQNSFARLEKKIAKLYEMDSNNNLTRLSDVKGIFGVIDEDKSLEYGGVVYDFSDKNYCLYGHVLSMREDIDDIVHGRSNATSNFISVSPVSYRGQKYYFDRSECIIAYDFVPSGNFVCSSISNMGSNYSISRNSSEVKEINRRQRGILETSAAVKNNSEALLFREGLIPCGLILPGGRKPTDREMEIHKEYGLPFIITQELNMAIDNPKYVFKNALDVNVDVEETNELVELIDMMDVKAAPVKCDEDYTGREIAVFADCHSMYEPTLAILESIRRNGIKEIYSLGDNVGLGPNPTEVMDLLEEYGVQSVAGNAEYYNTLGTEPFPYLTNGRLDSQLWTERQLGPERIDKLRMYPASIDLQMGSKKIALCHFANDVRWDFRDRSVHTYNGKGLSNHQFLYTNSSEALNKVTNCIVSGKGVSAVKGYMDSRDEPIFGGKKVTDYDCILQGHAHFEIEDEMDKGPIIWTLRAVGMGFEGDEAENEACYYVLRERTDGEVDVEKRYVRFNRNSLLASIHNCDLPSKDRVLSYVKKSR